MTPKMGTSKKFSKIQCENILGSRVVLKKKKKKLK